MRAIFFLVFAAAWRLNLAWRCSYADWWRSFDKKGYSTCGSRYKYINGLYRNSQRGHSDPIHLLKSARCCYEPSTYWKDPTDCQVPDWWSSFDRQGWSSCPAGHFLQALYRNNCDKLYCIEYGKCCKPASHPRWWGHCYNQNVRSSFNKIGTSKCRPGYFIAGLYRSSGHNLHNLEEFKCCTMVEVCRRGGLDFEKGAQSLVNWVRLGNAFSNQPTYGDNPTARRRGQPSNHQGHYWIGGFENRPSPKSAPGAIVGDGPQGILESPTLRITGPNVNFLIGGGCNIRTVRVELVVDNNVVRRATGKCTETMERRSWELRHYIGRMAFIRLVDSSSGGWGHINFDDFGGDIEICEGPPKLTSLSEVKTRVMDVTLPNLALLAYYLGYGWCAGCRAQWVGEDFRRNGDSWEAAKIGSCNGYKSDHRLKLHYGDFKLGIKSITFGSAVVQSMTPQVYLSGTVTNNDSHDTKTTIEREVRTVRTVTHTTSNSWTLSQELDLEISYTPSASGGVGGGVSYKFGYETTTKTKDSTSNQQWNIIKLKSEKTLKPHTKAKWQILVTKQRVTIPYTVIIIATFSAQMDGFLRWGGGYNGRSTNYHNKHRGSGNRPTFKYRFGSASIPFYQALKQQSNRNSRPWQWHDMKQKYRSAQWVINTLVNEKYYEFTLSGQFEDVHGTHADIQWHSLAGKRSVPLQDPAPNPGDPPRVFPKPPKVDIFKNRNHQTPAIPNERASGI